MNYDIKYGKWIDVEIQMLQNTLLTKLSQKWGLCKLSHKANDL